MADADRTRVETRVAWIWQTRVVPALDLLAVRPALLFAVLWALNAIKFPYGGLIHDARLYGLQAQNQASGGAYSRDLFLRFGSQDQFTPFSRVVGPLVGAFGLEWSFFVLYLLSNALLIIAMQRLIRTLIDDRRVATAAVIFLAVNPLSYGGIGVFHVTEAFFTPRLLSGALALFALERALNARYVMGAALAAAATVTHPLMGIGALTIVAATGALDRLPGRASIIAAAAVAICTAVVLGYPPWGRALFGTIDANWLQVIRNAATYNFPGAWSADDWIRTTMAIGLPIVAAMTLDRHRLRNVRFLLTASFAGTIGLLAMIVAGRLAYRLLLQGQPYRVLWILQLLEIPLALWLASRLWTADWSRRLAAVLLVAAVGFSGLLGLEAGLSFFACCACLALFQRPRSVDPSGEWIATSVVAGLAAGCLLAAFARAWLLVRSTTDLLSTFDPGMYLGLFGNAPGPLLWFAFALGAVTLVVGSGASARTIGVGSIAAALAIHVAAFAPFHLTPDLTTAASRDGDVAFVKDYFARVPPAATPRSVYEGTWADLGLVWFDLHATSYFHVAQLSGVMFNRETAIEAQRRAAVVRPFALEWHRSVERFMGPWDRMMALNLWGPDMNASAPTVADLRQLCRAEEDVDVAILGRNLGAAAATNGRIYIYECARVRDGTTDHHSDK
jgi:hypothetical protein